MSTTSTATAWPTAPTGARGVRFAREAPAAGSGDPPAPRDGTAPLEWVLKRNCSMAPCHVLWLYLALCVFSLGIATLFWVQGATMVMPFAGLELLAVGAAMLLYGRHAADRESIALRGGVLTVEHASGGHVERVAFQAVWVRVEPERHGRALVELSGQGRRMAVGRYVRPELRSRFADELRWALRRQPRRDGGGTR